MSSSSSSFVLASVFTLGLAPVACDGDDEDTGGDHGTGDDHHATAGDDHGTTDDHHGTADDHHGDETASPSDLAEAYCVCVFNACHDAYHAKWGDDEVASRAACIAEAEALQSNGGPTEMGNFIECRQHFCEAAAADEALCTNALGDAVCI